MSSGFLCLPGRTCQQGRTRQWTLQPWTAKCLLHEQPRHVRGSEIFQDSSEGDKPSRFIDGDAAFGPKVKTAGAHVQVMREQLGRTDSLSPDGPVQAGPPPRLPSKPTS